MSEREVEKAWREFNRLTASHGRYPWHGGWADCWCDQAKKIREAAEQLPSLRETLAAK